MAFAPFFQRLEVLKSMKSAEEILVARICEDALRKHHQAMSPIKVVLEEFGKRSAELLVNVDDGSKESTLVVLTHGVLLSRVSVYRLPR